jgi:hypothetical protein
VSDGALLQEGLVDDAASEYLNPSLAVDRDGNIGLGCTPGPALTLGNPGSLG